MDCRHQNTFETAPKRPRNAVSPPPADNTPLIPRTMPHYVTTQHPTHRPYPSLLLFQKHGPDSGHCLAGQLGQRTPHFLYVHSLWSTIFTQAVIGWSKNMNKRMPSTMLKFIKKNVFLPLVLSNLGMFSYLCIANHHKNERKIQNCLF